MIISASFDTSNPELWLNRAMQYGDGFFETMRVNNGTVPLLEFHLNRMQRSAKTLNLTHIDPHIIDSAIQDLNHSFRESCLLKLVVFRSHQDRTYQPKTIDIEWVISAYPLKNQQTNKLSHRLGVAKTELANQKTLAGLKHLSRLEQVMIAQELNSNVNVSDFLVLDHKKRVIETTYKNIVFIKDNTLFTPKLNNCGVYGVGLEWLESNFDIKSKHIKLKDIIQYEAILIGNSVRGFSLVHEVHLNGSNEVISFATFHVIHDKIKSLWLNQFNR